MSEKLSFPLWVIALATGSAVMGITIITPALPLIGDDLGASADAVQLLLTFYLLMLAFGQLVIGPLSDAIGRRPFFTAGAVLIALSGLSGLFASDITVLTAIRIIQGLGAAACMSMGRAMINDFFPKKDAQKAMASVQTIQAIVPMLALSIGGLIVASFGWKGVMGIILLAGIMLVFGALFLLPETHLSPTRSIKIQAVMASYKAVLTNPTYVAFMSLCALQTGAFFALNSFIAYWYQMIGIGSLQFGFYFAMTPLGYFCGNLFNRAYMVKRGIEKAAFIGCLLSLSSMVILAMTQLMGITSPLGLALPCMLFGFSNGLTVANSAIGGISAAGKYAGTGSGVIGAATMALGGITGTIFVSLGADSSVIIGIIGLFVMVMAALLNAGFLYRQTILHPASADM